MPEPVAAPPTPPIPLAALLSLEELGLRQIAGPAGAGEWGEPGVVVHWVHTSEMEDPYPYLLGGELLLSSGFFLQDAEDSDTYVSRIVQAGAAALGFGVAPVHDTVPRALIEACDRYGLPLVEVPPRTTFTAVARAVWRLMSQARLRELRRVTDAQQGLAAAAARPDPVPAVLHQLAVRLGGRAVLLGPDGTELHAAGRAPGPEAAGGLRRLAHVVNPPPNPPPNRPPAGTAEDVPRPAPSRNEGSPLEPPGPPGPHAPAPRRGPADGAGSSGAGSSGAGSGGAGSSGGAKQAPHGPAGSAPAGGAAGGRVPVGPPARTTGTAAGAAGATGRAAAGGAKQAPRMTGGPASGSGKGGPREASRAAPASATDSVGGAQLSAYALGGSQGLTLGLATPSREPGDHTVAGVAVVLLSLLTAPNQGADATGRSAALVRLLLGATPAEAAPLLGPERWTVVHARAERRTSSTTAALSAAALGAALGSVLVDPDADGAVRILLPADRPVTAQPGWILGVSAPAGPEELADADGQAARAVRRAAATRTALVGHRDTSLAGLLPPEEADAHARTLLAPLAGSPALIETLRTWLSLHGSWDRTAAALEIHRNTVRQRIARCATLLDENLDDADVRMELWFALRRL
ncbi:PucR family transcriptional regulator [Streptomyces sp. NBC_01142]|uniref:PucR family transcriptional regulator n=1 Tax=Streptomyces sp. NBC_01142 TaxID=2975865 RepID=UPI002254F4D2|nr:PucR family transcriptional regulator [Streptomyces sp. NBC_01142]MCX4823258.1 PucR family transcriptional regulator [Streptomyces sp. NBC_01142]